MKLDEKKHKRVMETLDRMGEIELAICLAYVELFTFTKDIQPCPGLAARVMSANFTVSYAPVDE